MPSNKQESLTLYKNILPRIQTGSYAEKSTKDRIYDLELQILEEEDRQEEERDRQELEKLQDDTPPREHFEVSVLIECGCSACTEEDPAIDAKTLDRILFNEISGEDEDEDEDEDEEVFGSWSRR